MGHARVPRLMIWTGPAFMALSIPGVFMARVLPPHSPEAGATEIAALYGEHEVVIRIGLCLLLASFTLYGSWSAVLVSAIRRMEGRFPVLTYASVVMLALQLSAFLFSVWFWAVASFRPGVVPPDLTRAFDDAGWLLFVWSTPPFLAFWALLGIAIMNDKNPVPILPRWVGWGCFWLVLLLAPTSVVLLFKTGPLAWNGAIGFWLPLVVYLVWMIILTTVLLRTFREDDADDALAARRPVALTPA